MYYNVFWFLSTPSVAPFEAFSVTPLNSPPQHAKTRWAAETLSGGSMSTNHVWGEARPSAITLMILHNVGYLLGERHGSHHPGCHLIKVRREFNLSTNRLNAVALHRHQHSRQDGCASTRFLSMKALTIVGENDRTHGDDSSSNRCQQWCVGGHHRQSGPWRNVERLKPVTPREIIGHLDKFSFCDGGDEAMFKTFF